MLALCCQRGRQRVYVANMPAPGDAPDRTASAAEATANTWKNLQYLRNAFRLSDGTIGQATDMHRVTIGNKLNGRRALTLEEGIRLSEFFGAPLEVLRLPRQEFAAWTNDHWGDIERHVGKPPRGPIDPTNWYLRNPSQRHSAAISAA